MTMKVKSDQIRTEHYHYTLATGENILFPIKARRDEVIIVHSVCLYNPTQADFTHAYKLMRSKGHTIRLNYAATLTTGVVRRWATDVYLIDGEECGFAITPAANGDIIAANFQIIRQRDDEYFKAT